MEVLVGKEVGKLSEEDREDAGGEEERSAGRCGGWKGKLQPCLPLTLEKVGAQGSNPPNHQTLSQEKVQSARAVQCMCVQEGGRYVWQAVCAGMARQVVEGRCGGGGVVWQVREEVWWWEQSPRTPQKASFPIWDGGVSSAITGIQGRRDRIYIQI